VGLVGLVVQALAAQRIAPPVVAEGGLEGAGVLARLAQRELQVEAVLVGQVRPLQLGFHGRHVGLGEADGLQVGQAPPGLTELRRQRDRAAVGLDRVGLAADGLQSMAVAHPDLGLLRLVLQHPLVEADRLFVLADPAERGGLQVAVAGVARILGQQAVTLGDRGLRLVPPVKHRRIVVPRRGEARGQLHAAGQQLLGVVQPAQARAGLGQHADGGHVSGPRLQDRAQGVLGDGEAVLAERGGGLDQVRVADAGADRAQVGGLGGLGLALAAQRRAQQAQGGRVLPGDAEDLAGLLFGGAGVHAQQPRGVVESDLERAHRLCRRAGHGTSRITVR
jgi:hypothetical protein